MAGPSQLSRTVDEGLGRLETNLVENIGDLFQTINNTVQYFRILNVSF